MKMLTMNHKHYVLAMGLIHYFYAHIILFNSPCALGSQPCCVLFANGAGSVEYFLSRISADFSNATA